MLRRTAYLSMSVSVLSTLGRRFMASFAAAGGTRYAVRLTAPKEGPVLGVASRTTRASATSSYEVLKEPAGNFDGLQVCVWIDSLTEGKDETSRAGPFYFEGAEQQLPIDGLGVGSHRLSAAVVAPSEEGGKTQLSEVTTTQIDVVLREDFVPSYEWQHVFPWQSVPPGLEVQLPLDGSGQRRARVPPSWRLQLYIPGDSGAGGNNGGFFLRTDLRAGSTVLELRQEIARQPRLGVRVDSVKLLLGGRVLGDEETAEGVDLFNRQKELTLLVDRRKGVP